MPATVSTNVARSFTLTTGLSDSAFNNSLGFRVIEADGDVGQSVMLYSQNGVAVGQRFDLGALAAGDSIEFFILQNGGQLLTGDAQARSAAGSDGTTTIAFEDLTAISANNPGGLGTDNDFNDLTFSVTPGASLAGRTVAVIPAGDTMVLEVGADDSHFNNSLGYRVVNADGSTGPDVLLFASDRTGSGQTYEIPGAERGVAIEFFILQDGGRLLTGDEHARTSLNADGTTRFGFEDLVADETLNPYGWGTDNDFNDLVFDVSFRPTAETVMI